MKDLVIKLDEIKRFFYLKRKIQNKIYRIFGASISYSRGEFYKGPLYFLKYIQSTYKGDLTEIIKDFEKMLNKKRVPIKQYEKDMDRYKKVIESFDMSELPPASGVLRKIQLEILSFAKEVLDDIKENTDIPVWLDGGTLLGAVRHKGFIPWDDDMDFATVRPYYNKLIEYLKSKYIYVDSSSWRHGKTYKPYLKECIKKYPNQIFCFRHADSFKCVKGTLENFQILDFFALDYYNDIHNVRTLQEYADSVKEKFDKLKTYKEVFELQDSEIAKNVDIVEKSDVINAGVTNFGFYWHEMLDIIRNSDIFPLQKLKFEDWEYYAPNNPNNYLKSIYNYYNRPPENGILLCYHANTDELEI